MVLNLLPDPVPAPRSGPWMMTVSGRRIYPTECVADDFHIGDIAHGLSNISRYNGQCLAFYSVAEHCVRGSFLARDVLGSKADPRDVDQLAWEFLLHDATEAYIGDMVGPLKKHMEHYREIEHSMDCFIRQRFRVRTRVRDGRMLMTTACKELDSRLLVTEAPYMFPEGAEPWWRDEHFPEPFGVAAGMFPGQHDKRFFATSFKPENFWTPRNARLVFLHRFNELRLRLHPLMTEGCEP